VLQVRGENPDIHCHHRHDTKYNQVFHLLPHFFIGIEIGRSGFGPTTTRSTQPGHG
jgi:hypothetical protein